MRCGLCRMRVKGLTGRKTKKKKKGRKYLSSKLGKEDNMKVVSVRLDQKEIKMIEKLARAQKKDKSSVTRELIDYGWYYLALKNYKDGKLSLGSLSKQLDLTLPETMDLLAEFGVTAPIDYADYLKGYEALSKK